MTLPSEPDLTRGRLCGVDYGTVRIGIALTDSRQTLASPHDNYTRRGPVQDAKYFVELAREENVAAFVVGLPVHTSGHESQKSLEARTFGAWLAELTGKPVVFFDERYTSAEAERWLIDADLTSKQRKVRLDKLAAQILLSAYLESRNTEPPQALEG